ncbi:MAG: hypothetical protein IJH57_02325 [Mogibacterium sp.]|nr:hypothetical protein [Mogibacterium sp.]
MTKKVLKRSLGIICMIAAVWASVWVLEEFVTRRYDLEGLNLQGYYEEDHGTIDVVIMGASEITQGFAAPEIYKNFGFTSAPFAFTVNPVPLWKYELRDIERTQNPELLIVEINGCTYLENKYIHRRSAYDRLAECMPFSMVKVNMIREMSDDTADAIETFFPICKYHENWSEFPQDDVLDKMFMMKNGHAILRGSQSNMYRDKIKEYPYYPTEEEMMELNPDAEEALRDFLEECKKSSIKNILFVCYPHIMSQKKYYQRQMRCNYAGQIIREAGFDYVDFDRKTKEIGLTKEDFFDDHHMLATGQRMFSNYLGEYIQKKYDLKPTQLSEKDKAEWEESVVYNDRLYRYFDAYMKAHADDPYTKHEFKLRDRRRPIRALSEMDD